MRIFGVFPTLPTPPPEPLLLLTLLLSRAPKPTFFGGAAREFGVVEFLVVRGFDFVWPFLFCSCGVREEFLRREVSCCCVCVSVIQC